MGLFTNNKLINKGKDLYEKAHENKIFRTASNIALASSGIGLIPLGAKKLKKIFKKKK